MPFSGAGKAEGAQAGRQRKRLLVRQKVRAGKVTATTQEPQAHSPLTATGSRIRIRLMRANADTMVTDRARRGTSGAL